MSVGLKREHWLVWLATVVLRRVTGSSEVDAEDVLGLLFVLDREFRRRFGRRLLGFRFVKLLGRVHSEEFYGVLSELAEWGIVEYAVDVWVPRVSPGVDRDTAWAIVRSDLDALGGKFVWRTVKPLTWRLDPPPDLLRLLREAGTDVESLAELAEWLAAGKFREAVEIALRSVEEGGAL